MAYVIYTQTPNGPQYAQHVGKTRVKWTGDRDKARRYVRWETAEKAALRIRDLGGPDHDRAMAGPDPAP